MSVRSESVRGESVREYEEGESKCEVESES